VRYASEKSLGRRIPDEDVEAVVRSAVWEPAYVPVRRIR